MRIRVPDERRLSARDEAALHIRISACPFCGGWSQLMTSEDPGEDVVWWGECLACGAIGPRKPSASAAQTAWDSRAALAAVGEEG